MVKKYANSALSGKSPLDWDKALQIVRLAAQREKKLALFILLGIHVGLRFSDLIKLKKQYLKDRHFKTTEKKTSKLNQRFIPESFYRELRRCGLSLNDYQENLFASTRKQGAFITPSYFRRGIKRYCAQIGLSKLEISEISTHSLRKTFANHFYDIYEDKHKALMMISRLFCHSSTEITMRYMGLDRRDYHDVMSKF